MQVSYFKSKCNKVAEKQWEEATPPAEQCFVFWQVVPGSALSRVPLRAANVVRDNTGGAETPTRAALNGRCVRRGPGLGKHLKIILQEPFSCISPGFGVCHQDGLGRSPGLVASPAARSDSPVAPTEIAWCCLIYSHLIFVSAFPHEQ